MLVWTRLFDDLQVLLRMAFVGLYENPGGALNHFLQVKLFTKLVELESLSTAAAELGIALATATACLTQLESRLGVQLVYRNTRRMTVTEDGILLYEKARKSVSKISLNLVSR
jgi:hypothetical protein